MIIKRNDSKEAEIGELEALLEGKLNPRQRFTIERELKAIRDGVSAEKDSAYYIDFYFGRSKNRAVIHDLRLEHKGQVAQIDQQVDKRNPLADLVTISKVCSSSTLMETARALAGLHTPKRINFRTRFGLPIQKQGPRN
jgi:hypothetical protein